MCSPDGASVLFRRLFQRFLPFFLGCRLAVRIVRFDGASLSCLCHAVAADLRTLWFELHVALAFFAYALFGIAALLGLLFLLRRERPVLDLQYRACLVGFTFFSASMIAGGIWGYYAWGTYWLWTPKSYGRRSCGSFTHCGCMCGCTGRDGKVLLPGEAFLGSP